MKKLNQVFRVLAKVLAVLIVLVTVLLIFREPLYRLMSGKPVRQEKESVVRKTTSDEPDAEEEVSGEEAKGEADGKSEDESPYLLTDRMADVVTAQSALVDPASVPTTLADIEQFEAGTVIPTEQINLQDPAAYFRNYEISDEIFARIYGDDRSFKTYCTVPREDLRYLKVLHYNYNHEIQVGEMIVFAVLADEVTSIFQELFAFGYEIEKMYLVERYGASDDLSVGDNNTACFNYRTATNSNDLSDHAYGCAIDLNPGQNPYFSFDENGEAHWANPNDPLYLDRSNPDWQAMHMITHEDYAYQLFKQAGWGWGGDWENPVDYQHFNKPVYTPY